MSTWKPIDMAPKQVVIDLGPRERRGPMIWLRDREHTSKGHWRHERSGPDPDFNQTITRPGRWEDQFDQPLNFDPTEWSEIEE